MAADWRALQAAHPRLFTAAIVLKKLRTKVALVIVVLCIILGYWRHQVPPDLRRPTALAWIGLALILAGMLVRLAAFGCLRKKEVLATAGVYSLCRHPLYLGSILMGYGFCCLLNEPIYFAVLSAYLLLFYPLTIFWEECRLAERYGADHAQYSRTTPLILPIGRFRPCGFDFGLAMRKGGALLIVTTAILLAGLALWPAVVQRH